MLSPVLAGQAAARRRFLRQARALARLRHPNLVTIFDVRDEGEHVFVVMDLVDGGTLAARSARVGPMDPGTVRDAVLPLLDALDGLHRAGVTHGSIKPRNVLLASDGTPQLGDLGAQPFAARSPAETQVLFGRWPYLAPEQLIPGALDARADIYAMGGLLQALSTGAPPDTKTPLPGPLGVVVARAMAESPDDRYPSAAALRDALRAVEIATPVPWARLLGRGALVIAGAALAFGLFRPTPPRPSSRAQRRSPSAGRTPHAAGPGTGRTRRLSRARLGVGPRDTPRR
ncbi:MAG: serine/threonine protein kinase, partial [Proteobacteria bacterium]|nr:serine/threonine protein kinase [Pseudomonadota bacterium]